MTPTAEQQCILDRPPTDTIKVLAGAGCGKTSTLEAYGRRWKKRGLYLAFNAAIAEEADRRLPPNVVARSAHGHAYRELQVGAFKGRRVERLKLEHLIGFEDDIQPVPGVSSLTVRRAILSTIEKFLISEGTKILPAHCEVKDEAQNLAIRKMAGAIALKLLRFEKAEVPFTHDIYLKRFEMWRRITGYDYLLLDEAQDLNPVLISLAKKAEIPIILVGDPFQSIYRFRGAVDAMDQFDVPEFPLTQSWRFGPEIGELANRILAHASKPPLHELRGNPTMESVIECYRGRDALQRNTAILARTNARLFEYLAELDRPFHLIGGIVKLESQLRYAQRLQSDRHSHAPKSWPGRFGHWKAPEASTEQGGDADMLRLRAIVEKYGTRLNPLLDKLTQLHRKDEADAEVVVSTAHKAKGREWDHVVVLDDFEPPADLAARRKAEKKNADELDQQINLLYVACTRARHRLSLAPKLYQALC